MVDFAKLNAERERYKAFLATDLGKLFNAFQHATVIYWQNDSNDRISDKRLTDLSDAQRKAQSEFTAKLMELANV